ncbi:MAG: sigma-54 interaction domain-containing protein [Phycisphaerales bacterium JB039]
MGSVADLQLALWREARHRDLAAAIPDLAGQIRRFVPIEAMMVLALEGDRCLLVATTEPAPAAGLEVVGAEAASIARFIRRGELGLLEPNGRSALSPLVRRLGTAPLVCAPLPGGGAAEGVVVWRLAPGARLDDSARSLLAGALEPLSAALNTSIRFHELEALRRAAEADSQAALRRLGRSSLREPIVGAERGLRTVMERAQLVAASDVPVLILGETGSGKEVIARAIHDRSRRHDGPFLRVNCGAIPAELVDSQLFGHDRGAFTGATEQRQGWFERADGGTLFLDEVAELPLAAQVRLLRVLQDGALERVGGAQTIRVDCRIIAATHRDLAEMVRQRTFREDLWYRLAVFPLALPALRERPEDLPDLVGHFARRASLRFGLPEFEVTQGDLERLCAYPWPGNIRELAAVIDRAALLGSGGRLAIDQAMGAGGPGPRTAAAAPPTPGPGPATLDSAIRAAIESALSASRGRVEGPEGAAARLAVNASTLRSKMRKLSIDATRFR